MTSPHPFDAIAERNTQRQIPYQVTDAGHAALETAGPSCRRRVGRTTRPCLRTAGHRGRCNPNPSRGSRDESRGRRRTIRPA